MASRNPRSSARSSQRRKKKRLPLGLLLWIVVIMLVVMYAAMNMDTLKTTVGGLLGKKDNAQQPQQQQGAAENTPNDIIVAPPAAEPASGTAAGPASGGSAQTAPQDMQQNMQQNAADQAATTDGAAPASPAAPTNQPANPQTNQQNQPAQTAPQTQPAQQPKQYATWVYFTRVRDDGASFALVKRQRSVSNPNTILTQTLGALFQGVTPDEQSAGARSFIPAASVIKSVSIRGKTAYIDISDGFLFNPMGRVATDAQIYQLVYTATEFSTIDNVQILINGAAVPYLSGEGGINVSSPIARRNLPPVPLLQQ